MGPDAWLAIGIGIYAVTVFVVHVLRLREEHRRGYVRGYCDAMDQQTKIRDSRREGDWPTGRSGW